MMVLLILALFVAYSEQKTSKRKVDNLRQKLTEKEKIIADAQEKLNKIIKSIKV